MMEISLIKINVNQLKFANITEYSLQSIFINHNHQIEENSLLAKS